MNNKILIAIIILLVGFLTYDKFISKNNGELYVADNFETNESDVVEEINNLEPVDVCSNIEGIQSSLPEGMVMNGDSCESQPVIVTETRVVKEVVNVAPSKPINQTVTPEPSQENKVTYSEPQRPFKEDGTLDLSKYEAISVSDYVNNSSKYLNKAIKIKNATIASFNSYSNNTNYITIIDKSDYSSNPKSITIEITDNNFYSELVEKTKEFTNVIVFGFGVEDREFNIVNSNTGTTYKDFDDVIVSDAIYKCTDSCIYNYSIGVKLIFEKKK